MRVLTLISIFSALFFAPHLATAQAGDLYVDLSARHYLFSKIDADLIKAHQIGRSQLAAEALASANEVINNDGWDEDHEFIFSHDDWENPSSAIAVGWRYHPQVAFEVVYHEVATIDLSGDYGANYSLAGDDGDVRHEFRKQIHSSTLDIDGYEISALIAPLMDDGQPAAMWMRVGWVDFDAEIKTDHAHAKAFSEAFIAYRGGSFVIGLEGQIDLSAHSALTLGFTRYNSVMAGFNMGLRYQF